MKVKICPIDGKRVSHDNAIRLLAYYTTTCWYCKREIIPLVTPQELREE